MTNRWTEGTIAKPSETYGTLGTVGIDDCGSDTHGDKIEIHGEHREELRDAIIAFLNEKFPREPEKCGECNGTGWV